MQAVIVPIMLIELIAGFFNGMLAVLFFLQLVFYFSTKNTQHLSFGLIIATFSIFLLTIRLSDHSSDGVFFHVPVSALLLVLVFILGLLLTFFTQSILKARAGQWKGHIMVVVLLGLALAGSLFPLSGILVNDTSVLIHVVAGLAFLLNGYLSLADEKRVDTFRSLPEKKWRNL